MGAGRGAPKFHAAVKKVISMAPVLMKWTVFLKSPKGKRHAEMMRETLCQQLKEERGSASLVSSISPVCRRDLILAVRNGQGLAQVIAHARTAIAAAAGISDSACQDAEMIMPLDYETALTFRATSIEDVMVDLTDDD